MTDEPVRRGLLDTNIMLLRSQIAPGELPDEIAISAVTLAELSAGPHEARPDTEQYHHLTVFKTAGPVLYAVACLATAPVQIHPVPGKIMHPAREGGTRARYQASLDDQWRARGGGAC